MSRPTEQEAARKLAAEKVAAARKKAALEGRNARKGQTAKREKQKNSVAKDRPLKKTVPAKEQATQAETAKQVESVMTKGLDELDRVERAKQMAQKKADDAFKSRLEARETLKGLLRETNAAEIGRQERLTLERARADADMQKRLSRAKEDKGTREKAKANADMQERLKEDERTQALSLDVARAKQGVELIERDLDKVSKSWGAWFGQRSDEISALQEKRDQAKEKLAAAELASKAAQRKAAPTTLTPQATPGTKNQSQGRQK